MKKVSKYISLLALVLLPSFAEAKRLAPQEIEVTFENFVFRSSTVECGIILIEKDGKIKQKRIYKVSYDSNLEKDVQDVWITDMFVALGGLMIRNEKNEIYEMNFKAFEVIERNGISQEQFEQMRRLQNQSVFTTP